MLPFDKPNPFHPGTGVLPPVLAGRDQLKQLFRDQLDNLGNPPSDPTPRVLLGPRGCGKTALLNWIAIKAEKRKLPVVALASDNLSSVAAISQELARQFPPKLLERVRGLIKEIRLNVGDIGGGVAIGDGGKEEKTNELRTWLETLGGVLLIDEAHTMPPEVGHILYNAIQSVGIKHPLMVVIAGTPDLEQVLGRSKATFIERVPAESIGLLPRLEAWKALFEPFGNHYYFKDEAMKHILDDAQDYPYFIQLWGQSLWDTLTKNRTSSPDQEMINEARKSVNENRLRLYNRRVQELDNSGLLVPIAEMAWRLGEVGKPTGYDFNLALQHLYPHQGFSGQKQLEVKQQLLHTGFVWQPKVGTWEYGIPSLASHIRRESVRLLLDTLRQRPANIIALAAVNQCFGEPSDHLRELPRDRVAASIKDKLRESGIANEDMPSDPVGRFLAEKLLIKGDTPVRVCLAAPHLVLATVKEAIRCKLLPDTTPPEESKPDSPSTSLTKPDV